MARYSQPISVTHPDLAQQCVDPNDAATVSAGSGKKIEWRCDLGHEWSATIGSRCLLGSGCPYCSGQRAIPGETDIATTHPNIARQAVDQSLTTALSAGCHKKIEWRCDLGHEWSATVNHRCLRRYGCPYCSGKRAIPGETDIATTHPNIARQAVDQSLTTALSAGCNKKIEWRCNVGHEWSATVDSRCLRDRGCPSCANYGFDPSKPGYVYVLETLTHGVFGISNNPQQRLKNYCQSRQLVGLYRFDDGEAARCAETCIKQSFGMRGLSLEPGEVTESFDLTNIDLIIAAILEHGGVDEPDCRAEAA